MMIKFRERWRGAIESGNDENIATRQEHRSMRRSRIEHVATERPGRVGGVVKLGRRRGAVLTSNDRDKTIEHQRRGVLRARDLE